MNSLKKKVELSKILESIEVNKDTPKINNLLDEYHTKAKAHVIGITGPPGVGKSSLINALIKIIRHNNFSVGVIAVDPSSRKSGGALLGDRARFSVDPKDYNIFIRSLAAKDSLGGISEMTYPCMSVMRSFFDILIVETVGVGQSEISIEDVADSIIFCVQPGSGDTLQFMKSGIIEIPDIICVTKNDLMELSNNTIADLKSSSKYLNSSYDWPIEIMSVSSEKQTGINKLFVLLQKRWKWLQDKNILNKKRYYQDKLWIEKKIKEKIGEFGFKLVKRMLVFKSQPYKFYYKIINKIKIELN